MNGATSIGMEMQPECHWMVPRYNGGGSAWFLASGAVHLSPKEEKTSKNGLFLDLCGFSKGFFIDAMCHRVE